MEYRWALQCWAEGRDHRELLDSLGQLDGHLRACQSYPAQLWLFRFHPDVWHKHDLEETCPTRLWSSDLWSDCLSLHLAGLEHAFLNYFREAGDDGLLLYNPGRDSSPVAMLLHDDEVAMAGWHTIGAATAVPLMRKFLDTGFLPEAPAGAWWIDSDEQKVSLDEVWDEQAAAWDEERARWQAWLRPYNQRGREYAREYAQGRACPLCQAAGAITFTDGDPLQRCAFWCQACQRRFEVSDVDRTPLGRVE